MLVALGRQEQRQRHGAVEQIHSQGLAGGLGIAVAVEHVVCELEGDAELLPESLQCVDAWPVEAAEQVRALAEEFNVDEVMVHPVASARRGTDPATAPARIKTLELLAKELF